VKADIDRIDFLGKRYERNTAMPALVCIADWLIRRVGSCRSRRSHDDL